MQAAGAYGASHFTRTFALQPGSTITKRFFANHPTVLQVSWALVCPVRSVSCSVHGPTCMPSSLNLVLVLQVGETVFVHGGVLPQHVEYGLDKINRQVTQVRHVRGPSTGHSTRLTCMLCISTLVSAGRHVSGCGVGQQGGLLPAPRATPPPTS
jgi:hypothetical protein